MPVSRNSMHVRFAETADFDGINGLFNRVFKEQRSREEFHWKFCRSPWAGAVPAAVIGTYANQIIGVFGLLPHRFRWGERGLSAIQVIDVCVDPAFRQSGVNRALLDYFLQQGGRFSPLAFGFPGEVYARIGLEKLGYRLLSRILTYTAEIGQSRQRVSDKSPWDILSDDSFPRNRDWSQLLSDASGKLRIATDRTTRYLHWRYQAFPGRQFRFYTAQTGKIVEGFLIVRPPASNEETEWRIYELIALRPEIVTALLSRLAQEICLQQTQSMTYLCSEFGPWQDELKQIGFYQVSGGPAHAVGALLQDKHSILDHCFDPSAWYFTLGDTDL